jgi:hypothetical protein
MTFSIHLELTGELREISRTGDDFADLRALSQYDQLVHTLAAQCAALSDSGAVRFSVSGFGDEHWPVDVRTDLAVILEQLPEVSAGLREDGKVFQLNFFEQGIERYLTGKREGTNVTFECTTMNRRWRPEPTVETMPLADARTMFQSLVDNYCRAVTRVCPWTTDEQVFQSWKRPISFLLM